MVDSGLQLGDMTPEVIPGALEGSIRETRKPTDKVSQIQNHPSDAEELEPGVSEHSLQDQS